MNGDIQAARKLLADLREGFRVLPKHIQVAVSCLLRETTLDKQSGGNCAR
ncbi:MAG: hypothetical protein ABSD20_01025 [Terriglobales bacterium]